MLENWRANVNLQVFVDENAGEAGSPLSDNVCWLKDVRNMPINLLKEFPGWIYQH